MGEAVLEKVAEVEEIELTMPNIHCLLVGSLEIRAGQSERDLRADRRAARLHRGAHPPEAVRFGADERSADSESEGNDRPVQEAGWLQRRRRAALAGRFFRRRCATAIGKSRDGSSRSESRSKSMLPGISAGCILRRRTRRPAASHRLTSRYGARTRERMMACSEWFWGGSAGSTGRARGFLSESRLSVFPRRKEFASARRSSAAARWSGRLDEELLRRKDAHGVCVREAIEEFGLKPARNSRRLL